MTKQVKNELINCNGLLARIELITKYQKRYIANSLRKIALENPHNVNVICDYIIAEQNEINLKESTKEGKIKCLAKLSTYLHHKPFRSISKGDVLGYLTSLKKPESVDPQHKSIGTYNGRQMILLKFFRWLYNSEVTDPRKRVTPPCMDGVRRLPRLEISTYKPSDLWTEEEHEVFLKYCPSLRDKAYHAMAYDTSARASELLSLRVGDIFYPWI
jgi:site-specific recombinase XerD